MNKTTALLAVAVLLGLLAVPEALGQRGPRRGGGGGWGATSQYNQLYDSKTIETVSGEVLAVEHITSMKGMGYGVPM